jgi:predicted nucleic acid-binding protein
MAGLAAVAEAVDRGRAVLMISVLWRGEVFESSLSIAQRRKLDDLFAARSVEELSIDSRVMTLAAEIRSFHKQSKSKSAQRNIRLPDAIHLASAIHYEANEFHTFDGAKVGGAAGGLLTLSGNVAGHSLKICRPNADQFLLDFGSEDSGDSEELP